MRIGGRRWQQAHRVFYQLFRGPIPAGLHLDHLCRVASCANPDHLEAVTPAENHRRSMPYRRTAKRRAGLHAAADSDATIAA